MGEHGANIEPTKSQHKIPGACENTPGGVRPGPAWEWKEREEMDNLHCFLESAWLLLGSCLAVAWGLPGCFLAAAWQLLGCCLAAAWQLPSCLWKSYFCGFGIKFDCFGNQFLVLWEVVGNNFGTFGASWSASWLLVAARRLPGPSQECLGPTWAQFEPTWNQLWPNTGPS